MPDVMHRQQPTLRKEDRKQCLKNRRLSEGRGQRWQVAEIIPRNVRQILSVTWNVRKGRERRFLIAPPPAWWWTGGLLFLRGASLDDVQQPRGDQLVPNWRDMAFVNPNE